MQAGIGTARVLLPITIRSVAGGIIDTVEYTAATPSGSFSQKALNDLLLHAQWADGVLLAGDLGRNSETAVVLEKFCRNYSGAVTFTKDATDYANNQATFLLKRPDTLLVTTLAQLQRLFQAAAWAEAVTFGMDLVQLVQVLQRFTTAHPVHLVTKQRDVYVVASGGQVVTSPAPNDPEEHWRLKVGTTAAVWWLQHPRQPLEALTTSLL